MAWSDNIYPYKECTWWVWGRVDEAQGIQLPAWGNAENWYARAQAAGYDVGGIYTAKPGDILCWGHRYNPDTVGHVQYVESDNGTTLTVSESYAGLSSPPAYVTISKSNPTYGRGDGFPFQGVIHLSGGGGGGDDPDDPPEPQPGGHWEWVEETITVITYGGYDYTGTIYECGANDIWSGQSGTQDAPQAPTLIHPGGGRLNERWEPFNMYTDERTLTYTTDGQPVWSNWETKYTGSDNFLLGQQPTYGNGWEMEWQGDDD